MITGQKVTHAFQYFGVAGWLLMFSAQRIRHLASFVFDQLQGSSIDSIARVFLPELRLSFIWGQRLCAICHHPFARRIVATGRPFQSGRFDLQRFNQFLLLLKCYLAWLTGIQPPAFCRIKTCASFIDSGMN